MKKTLNEPNRHEELIKMAVITLGMNIDGFQKVGQFLFFSNFYRSRPAINCCFWPYELSINKAPNQPDMSEPVEHGVDQSRK